MSAVRLAINISIRYGSEWVTFCCSYIFCHKMVTNGRILVFEVSIRLNKSIIFNDIIDKLLDTRSIGKHRVLAVVYYIHTRGCLEIQR